MPQAQTTFRVIARILSCAMLMAGLVIILVVPGGTAPSCIGLLMLGGALIALFINERVGPASLVLVIAIGMGLVLKALGGLGLLP